MLSIRGSERDFPWLELLIALLVISLVFQNWPVLFWTLLWAIDVRNWFLFSVQSSSSMRWKLGTLPN
jgi:hypothetical protein